MPDPPVNLADGGAIAAGVDAELDELRSLGANAPPIHHTIEERERKRTGIHSLKVRFNNVFGYSIEVTRSNLAAGARRIRAQADPGQRRTLHHSGAEAIRDQRADRA